MPSTASLLQSTQFAPQRRNKTPSQLQVCLPTKLASPHSLHPWPASDWAQRGAAAGRTAPPPGPRQPAPPAGCWSACCRAGGAGLQWKLGGVRVGVVPGGCKCAHTPPKHSGRMAVDTSHSPKPHLRKAPSSSSAAQRASSRDNASAAVRGDVGASSSASGPASAPACPAKPAACSAPAV